MDPLDDVFAAMRVESALYARLEARAPWGVDFAEGERARFGLVTAGQCWLEVEDEQPLRLHSGDCFVLVRGSGYILRDDPGSDTRSCVETVRDHIGGTVALGGGGEAATIITGWFTFDASGARPLIDLLPRVLHARIDHGRSQLLQATLQLLNLETETPGLGSSLVVSRLADIVFVHAIRAHVEAGGDAGWLAALSDRRIGAALKAMHADPASDWTLDALAGLAGMSRSAFALHFKKRVGAAPLAYLTRWRMFRAGCLMRQTGAALAEIAADVGYESEAAFNKAFKRSSGVTPGVYRRAERAPARPPLPHAAAAGMP